MKNICIKYFNNPLPGISNLILIENLCDIIKYSSKNSLSCKCFLDVFDFIENLFISNKDFGFNFEVSLLKLTNMLCLQLAVEFRFKVCDFMEKMFDNVLRFYKRRHIDFIVLVFHYLITSIHVHESNETCKSDNLSYACNLQIWKSQIIDIYLICLDYLKCFFNEYGSVIEIDFLDLFVEVSHLVR